MCQVNHRTLGSIMVAYTTYHGLKLLNTKGLSKSAKASIAFLLLSLYAQMCIGIYTIWNGVPIDAASLHQIGAMTVFTAFIVSSHCSRRVDPRHIQNMLGKLRHQDKA